MKASYIVFKTPDHLVRNGTYPYTIQFLLDGRTEWEHTNRARCFYETEKTANAAGKRYLLKMKKEGFEI